METQEGEEIEMEGAFYIPTILEVNKCECGYKFVILHVDNLANSKTIMKKKDGFCPKCGKKMEFIEHIYGFGRTLTSPEMVQKMKEWFCEGKAKK